MTQARLPYKDDDEPGWRGQPDSPALNEYRALRDAYAEKALRALTSRWHMAPARFEPLIDCCKRVPIGYTDGLLILASSIPAIDEWAAVTRFAWLCEKVWDMECARLATSRFQ
jgi:hypothetical protein